MKRSPLAILITSLLALAMCVVLPSCKKKPFCQKNENGAAVCNVGEFINFGHYEQDDNAKNGKEPITWRILSKNDKGQYLLISEKVLDVKPYNTTQIAITWEASTLRSWLNGYDGSYNTVGDNFASDSFIHTAFTEEEKAKIIPYDVNAHADSPAGNAAMDKIFLLSEEELKKYFPEEDDRGAEPTDYADEKGAARGACEAMGYCTWPHYRNRVLWWIRGTNATGYLAASIVSIDGHLILSDVHKVDGGVRPALWVQY